MNKRASVTRNVKRPEGEALRTALIESQFHFSRQQTHGLVIVLAGMLSSDIEAFIRHLNSRMDPRNIRVHALDAGTDPLDRMELELYPPSRRFWLRLPARGTISVFIDGWYHFLFDPAQKLPKDTAAKLARRDRGELFLANEQIRVMKIWLDRSKKGLKTRLEELDADRETRWQISDHDRQIARHYKTYRKRIDQSLTDCDAACCWTMIDMDDSAQQAKSGPKDSLPPPMDRLCHAILDALDNVPKIDKGRAETNLRLPTHDARAATALLKYRGQYPSRLQPADPDSVILEAQRRLREATDSKLFRDRSLVVAFEGYDAAGKGGTIHRLVHGIDPRRRNVMPIAAPSSEELRYPYLWRFWKALPPRSDVTIFDRSWYGRVLVERVESLISRTDWERAYGEINDFEEEITRHGVILVKLWLDVSAAEQKKRFSEREQTPWKRYKLTEDDWRNRRRRAHYEKALADMLAYTHNKHAPWLVIPSDDKEVARARALTAIADHLEQALGIT